MEYQQSSGKPASGSVVGERPAGRRALRNFSRPSVIVVLLLATSALIFGTVQWSSTPKMVATDVHGVFPAFAQTDTSSPTEWTNYLEPIVKCGPNNAASQANCPAGSASIAWYIKGGSIEVKWNLVAPTKTSTISGNSGGSPGSYVDTDTNQRVNDWWSCNGDTTNCASPPHKPVIFMIEPTSYSAPATGSINPGVPNWYACPGGSSPCVGQSATLTSTADGIITVSTGSSITFLVGTLVGSNPKNGCTVGSSDGATQCVAVSGTSTAMDGTWAICDHRTTIGSTTCQDPSSTRLSLISTAAAVSSTSGTIGNPIMDLATNYCGEGGLPVFWTNNFSSAIHDYMTHVFTVWGGTSLTGNPPPAAVVEFEPGFLHGYESLISGNNSANAGTNSCRSILNAAGYPAGEPNGANFLVGTYLTAQYQWLAGSVAGVLTNKPISVSVNFSIFGSNPDTATPMSIAKAAVANGLGINSNGLQRGNPATPSLWEAAYSFPADITVDNDAPRVFDLYAHGARGAIWQTVKFSDPTNVLNTPNGGQCGGDKTCSDAAAVGPMGLIISWAIQRGVNVLEPYMRTVECATVGLNGVPWANGFGYPGQDTLVPENYNSCENPGAGMPYDKAFIYAGQQLN